MEMDTVRATYLTMCVGLSVGSVCTLHTCRWVPTENYAKCIFLHLKMKSYKKGTGEVARQAKLLATNPVDMS